MACPFFMPMEKLANGAWPHPARLPLGCGWSGQCTAPGHEGEIPSDGELELCNLGYASGCGRLPQQRAWDAVRFAVVAPAEITGAGAGADKHQSGESGSARRTVQVQYVCERAHLPAEHGRLEFDGVESRWLQPHSDARVQKMAECFLAAYLTRKKLQTMEVAAG